jgi:hypothetical protein
MADEIEAADPRQHLVVGAGEVRFGTFRRGDGEPLAVAYQLDPATRTLVRREAPPRSPLDEQPALPVLDQVHAFRIRALDPDGWHDDWTTDTLPRAIEIVLQLGNDQLALRATIPAAR